MTGQRPRARFVPTLTEVVRPAEVPRQSVGAAGGVNASTLDAMVDELLPEAREQLRRALRAAAHSLIEVQLESMEDAMRLRLRRALQGAAGMAPQGPYASGNGEH